MTLQRVSPSMNLSRWRILISIPAQICASVRTGDAPGGLTGRVAEILVRFTDMWSYLCGEYVVSGTSARSHIYMHTRKVGHRSPSTCSQKFDGRVDDDRIPGSKAYKRPSSDRLHSLLYHKEKRESSSRRLQQRVTSGAVPDVVDHTHCLGLFIRWVRGFRGVSLEEEHQEKSALL